ncbi:MAG: cobalt-precorrin 5A hydrolase [Thermoplasmatales archaeon]|nr:cobalt-precorrin 5A hydrolase [Thermoplasmatales archaeon]
MRVSIVCFSPRGAETMGRIAGMFESGGHEVDTLSKGAFAPKSKRVSLGKWTEKAFRESRALVFVGAAGIAVRHVAPFVKDKTTDPAVIVVDELGLYSIPILSGHLGGANEIAKDIAATLGSVPVITTASDINNLLSPDMFAKRNGLIIGSMVAAKDVAGAIVSGREVCFRSDYPTKGAVPKELTVSDSGDIGICVSGAGLKPFKRTLLLAPRNLVLGVGCRRGTPQDRLAGFLKGFSKEAGFDRRRIAKVVSIDLKSDEAGLLEFAEGLGAGTRFFTSDELAAVAGDFDESEFVKKTTGVGNVCERSAVAAGGVLVHGKKAGDGITMAVSETPFTVSFEVD